ncbi:MAG: glycosyltransferase [bacterium]
MIAGRSGWHDPALEGSRNQHVEDVVWTGELADEQVATLLEGAELAVNASRYEGFGLAVLEALAHGVPLVSTHVPALSHAAADAYWRVAAGDVGGFACALGALATDPALRARLAVRGRARGPLLLGRRGARRARRLSRRARGRAGTRRVVPRGSRPGLLGLAHAH